MQFLKGFFFLLIVLILTVVLVGTSVMLRYKHIVNNAKEYWDTRSHLQGEVVLVVLGDSAAQSIGATLPENGYVNLLTTKISEKTGKSVLVKNLSVAGAGVAQVISQQIPQLEGIDGRYYILSVGANDAIRNTPVEDIVRQFEILTPLLPAGTFIAEVPAYRWGIVDDKVIEINAELATMAEANSLRIVPLHAPTFLYSKEGAYYDFDFFHPNNKGHELWAQTFWTVMEEHIR